MAVISGFLPQFADSGYDRLYITGDLDDYTDAWIGNRVPWESLPSPGVEALTENYPVSTTPLVRSGSIARSYFDDYYNRIHVVPRVLDIGNLLSVQTRDATVWNAYFTSQSLASITESGTAGLTETGITAPTVFAPLEERTYSITVDTAGPATINALYTFAFPLESPTLAVTGRRVTVFGHAPNWGEPVRERLAWLTDVILAESGVEQRAGLRAVPRRALAYSLLTRDRHESNRLETTLIGWQARLFAVPVWTDFQVLDADLPAGSTVVPCATAGYEFAADGLALLWRAHDVHEAVEVASVGGSSLTLAAPTLADWPAGTRLLPVRLGRLPERQRFTRESAHHLQGEVEFAFDDHPGVTPVDTGDTYAGFRVYAAGTNWADPIETEALRQVQALDYDTAAGLWVDDLSGLATLLKTWHWTLRSRDEIVALRAWLAARAGRRVPFWSTSQGVDMEVVATIGASDGAIAVRNIGYALLIDARADRRHLLIETTAGARYYRAITGATEIDPDTESIAIDTSLGATLQPAEIRAVRFLHLTRLDTDEVEIAWVSAQIAECSTLLRSLPQ